MKEFLVLRSVLIIIFFLVFRLVVLSQDVKFHLMYRTAPNTTALEFQTVHISSDYGIRNSSGNSKWHRGIDYSVLLGNDDKGYRLISPVNGTVTGIYKGNYIILIIKGDNNSGNFGYGHIFETSNEPSIVVGNMVLKQINGKPGKYAIIDLSHNPIIAFGSEIGTVTYNQQTYNVSQTISVGQDIAPLGDSDSDNAHLHLYLTSDPYSNPNVIANINIAKNPLQLLYHADNKFDVVIDEMNNLTEYSIGNSFYSGNSLSSIKLRIEMPDAGNGSYYDEETMDIDSVLLQIKRIEEPDSKYALIKGDNYHSKITLGGRLDHKRYPSPKWPPSNASFDIAKQDGSISSTGIKPFAYSSSGAKPYDFWYLSDFYTRIHKSDYFSGNLELANSNAEARYPDGVYLLRPKAYRIDNSEAVNPNNPANNAPRQIIIDNFQPFVLLCGYRYLVPEKDIDQPVSLRQY